MYVSMCFRMGGCKWSMQHVAVLEVCKHLESTGCRVTYLPVDEHGLVETAKLTAAIDPAATVMVSIMHANNETGTVQVPPGATVCAADARCFSSHQAAAVSCVSWVAG
jgi:cysteine sulfinate desulfinase/cysteine desulfurase-like protein